jgi:hypothetical protein
MLAIYSPRLGVRGLAIRSGGVVAPRLGGSEHAARRTAAPSFELQFTWYAEWGFERGCLLGSLSAEIASHFPRIRECLLTVFREWTEDIRTALSQAQSEERLSPRLDAEELVRFLLDADEGSSFVPVPCKNGRELSCMAHCRLGFTIFGRGLAFDCVQQLECDGKKVVQGLPTVDNLHAYDRAFPAVH